MESKTKTQSEESTSTTIDRKNTDTDLKSSIIEFMRTRPFLWNTKHPNYKDHKRREQEFQMFGGQINCDVQRIKQVWHVLRTNFFRAHKLLLNRPQSVDNGDKLWKYYLAMEYILDGIAKPSMSDDENPPGGEITHAPKRSRVSSSRVVKLNDEELNDRIATTSNNVIIDNSCNTNSESSRKSSHNKLSSSSPLNEFSMLDPDDDDNLYARSLTLTLKKFDLTTKEIIKLKFQEIIVNYMKQQQDRDCTSVASKTATTQMQSQSQQDLKQSVITVRETISQ